MAPAPLEVSPHAALRLKERRISRTEVRRCIALGETTRIDISGRFIAELPLARRTLLVVYLKVRGGYLLITAYWKD
jgi:hypothetical protein